LIDYGFREEERRIMGGRRHRLMAEYGFCGDELKMWLCEIAGWNCGLPWWLEW
jgi:hypothetical protein